MNESLYEVAFSGQIQEGAKLDEVRARIARMFKADEVTIARLFSGKPVVIKKNLGAEAADKYSVAFSRVGAICELTLISADTAPSTPAHDRAATEAPASAPADRGAASNRGFRKIAALFSRLFRRNTPR